MIIGTTIHQGIDALTAWVDSAALNGNFTVQLIAVSEADVDLEFQVIHRNRDDTGPGSPLGSAATIEGTETLPKTGTITATGLKELWRLRIQAKNGSNSTHWARYQVINPSFYDSAS